MGLLEKINPKATVSSVIHQALVGGIIGAVGGALVGVTGYCFALPDRRSLTEYWPHLVGLTLVAMFVWAVYEWQVPEEAIDLLDLVSRLERCFGVRVSREELSTIVTSNDPRDITVADLFDFIRGEVLQSRVLDSDLDANALWPVFQRAISDALGVKPEEGAIPKWGDPKMSVGYDIRTSEGQATWMISSREGSRHGSTS